MPPAVKSQDTAAPGERLRALLRRLPLTPLHPQWLSNRYHLRSRRKLAKVRDSVVLDVGSGDSDSAATLGPGNHLVRLDYPGTNVRYRNPPQVYADARRLPLADACADTVLLLEVLEHVDGAEQAMSEVSRVLRPGGVLFISVPMIYPIHDAPHDYRRFTIHGLNTLLASHAFSPREVDQHGNSWVTAMQLVNLAVLELAMAGYRRHVLLGLGATVIAYPICLLGNLIAAPLLAFTGSSRSCFGYFVEAVRA